MRKIIDICSLLCAVVAVVSAVFGIRVLMGKGIFVGLRIFSMAESGTFMGFLGNLLGMVITCMGFGVMAFLGFKGGSSANKKGFLYGAAMTVLSVVSMIMAIVSGSFTIGDMLMAALPAVYTYALLKTA